MRGLVRRLALAIIANYGEPNDQMQEVLQILEEHGLPDLEALRAREE